MDSNPSQPPVSTPVDTEMHKKDQQATGGPTSLGVTSEARANPQLSSGMSAFNLTKPIYLASFIIHFKPASGNDASAASTAEADPGNFAPSDFVPQQQGINKGTKNTSYDHLFVEASNTIKLEDLAKLVSHVQPSFKDLDSPEDDLVIVMDDSDEVNATNKAKAEAALLKAQPSFPNVEQLKELPVKSLKTEFSNILPGHNFSSSLLTELKDLPSKFDKLPKEVKGLKKQVHELEIELPGDLKEIPTKLKDFTKTVASVQAKLKTLNALPGLLLNVTKALNKFSQVLYSGSSKSRDQSVPLAGQANTRPAEGEKDTNQATIS
ncbi:hypothetical protein Tco_1256556 [Tanacetum coccineum]